MAFSWWPVKYIISWQEVWTKFYDYTQWWTRVFWEILWYWYDPVTAKSITYQWEYWSWDVTNSMTIKDISSWEYATTIVTVTYKDPSNPTISQVHIDWVTYDLRDRNAGEWVTTEEKAKLAALPEAAEIPSDIGPKSEVVEEVPSEYVAGKVYFIAEGGWTLKTYEELIAYTDAVELNNELNKYPEEYYEALSDHLIDNSDWRVWTVAFGSELPDWVEAINWWVNSWYYYTIHWFVPNNPNQVYTTAITTISDWKRGRWVVGVD